MASISVPASAVVARESTERVPWYVWCSVIAVTSAMIGGHWDISWHRSIGRDTFWTPAHIAIYMCGVLAGISCGYLILTTTFSRAGALRETSVKIWGFRGPLGAFLAAWGGIAMLTSAPFDDWWHSAYGLDVKIVSPPHVLLILGIIGVELGALILILGNMNRSAGALRAHLNWLFLYVGAMILVILTILIMEYTSYVTMHQARTYRIISMFIPLVLAGVARASERRWAATTLAGFYTLFQVGLVWILPLFPAEPKLGPVFQKVTHFIPPEFPALLIVPAIALDLLWQRTKGWNKWLQAAVSGVLFVGLLLAVEWPWAEFMTTPATRNWIFGTNYFQYNAGPNWWGVRHMLAPSEPAGVFRNEMLLAVLVAIVTTRMGLAWGTWMQRIRR